MSTTSAYSVVHERKSFNENLELQDTSIQKLFGTKEQKLIEQDLNQDLRTIMPFDPTLSLTNENTMSKRSLAPSSNYSKNESKENNQSNIPLSHMRNSHATFTSCVKTLYDRINQLEQSLHEEKDKTQVYQCEISKLEECN